MSLGVFCSIQFNGEGEFRDFFGAYNSKLNEYLSKDKKNCLPLWVYNGKIPLITTITVRYVFGVPMTGRGFSGAGPAYAFLPGQAARRV